MARFPFKLHSGPFNVASTPYDSFVLGTCWPRPRPLSSQPWFFSRLCEYIFIYILCHTMLRLSWRYAICWRQHFNFNASLLVWWSVPKWWSFEYMWMVEQKKIGKIWSHDLGGRDRIYGDKANEATYKYRVLARAETPFRIVRINFFIF